MFSKALYSNCGVIVLYVPPGESDEVCCFFCDGRLVGWQSGEDPMTKHRCLYPHCGFVRLTGPIDEVSTWHNYTIVVFSCHMWHKELQTGRN